jgi:hypothetical protein
MELTISIALIGKSVLFALISLLLVMFILFPINDRPTSRWQVIFWIISEVLLFSVIFDLISFRIVA